MKIIVGEDTSFSYNSNGTMSTALRLQWKQGGGEDSVGEDFHYIEVMEMTGGRGRPLSAMPLNGLSDAADYGGRKRASIEDLMESKCVFDVLEDNVRAASSVPQSLSVPLKCREKRRSNVALTKGESSFPSGKWLKEGTPLSTKERI